MKVKFKDILKVLKKSWATILILILYFIVFIGAVVNMIFDFGFFSFTDLAGSLAILMAVIVIIRYKVEEVLKRTQVLHRKNGDIVLPHEIYCSRCNRELEENFNYCPECGSELIFKKSLTESRKED